MYLGQYVQFTCAPSRRHAAQVQGSLALEKSKGLRAFQLELEEGLPQAFVKIHSFSPALGTSSEGGNATVGVFEQSSAANVPSKLVLWATLSIDLQSFGILTIGGAGGPHSCWNRWWQSPRITGLVRFGSFWLLILLVVFHLQRLFNDWLWMVDDDWWFD